MNTKSRLISSLLIFSLIFGQSAIAAENNTKSNPVSNNLTNSDYLNNEVIVGFKNGKTDAFKNFGSYFKSIKGTISSVNAADVVLQDGVSVETAISALKGNPDIDFIQPNYIYKNRSVSQDPKSDNQWGLENTGALSGAVAGADINIKKAWNITKGSKDVIVAVLDTGVDVNHPDLKDNIWVNSKEIPNNGKDDDGNGYVDDVNGWNFINGNNGLYNKKYDGVHGTAVAGVIAASMNNIGIVGVAPGVKIMPVKMDADYAIRTTFTIIWAIDYAEQNGAQIANCSWGNRDYDSALEKRIQKSKMLFVFAAGNDSIDNDNITSETSNYDCDNIIAVGATDYAGNLTSFSNYGEKSVDVAAPGLSILTTIPHDEEGSYDSAYGYENGTSFSAPFVSGIAALLYSNGITDPLTVKSRIISSCKPESSLTGKIVSGGIADAYNALTYDSTSEIPGKPLLTQNNGNISSDKQDAVYFIDLNAGDNISLDLTGLSKYNLCLYNPDTISVKTLKNLAAFSDENEIGIRFTAPVSGRYYIDVNFSDIAGNFQLNYKKLSDSNDLLIEDNSPLLSTDGNSITEDSTQFSGGSSLFLNSQGSFSSTFEGCDIRLICKKDKDQGIAQIYIDGAFDSEVDLYSNTPQYQQQLFYKKLNYRKHTIRISWSGKHNAASSSNEINIDCFKASTVKNLEPPTGLTAFQKFRSIQLTINNDGDDSITSYNIYRSTDGINFSLLKNYNFKAYQYYSDGENSSNQLANRIYYYRVTSINKAGVESPQSNIASSRPLMPNYSEVIPADSPKIQYSGNWLKGTDSSGKTTYTSNEKGATASLRFTGDRLTMYFNYTKETNFTIETETANYGYSGSSGTTDSWHIDVDTDQRNINETATLKAQSGPVTILNFIVYDENPNFPSAPENLTATGGNGITLTWAANSEENLAGYNVYKSDDAQNFSKLNHSPLKHPTFTDNDTIKGKKYFYTVTAVNTSGNESRLTSSGIVDETAIYADTTISGVYNGESCRGPVTITFNEGTTATLNDQPFESGGTVDKEGQYNLTTSDYRNRKTALSFTIDNTPPVVTGAENNKIYTDKVILHFNEGYATLNDNPISNDCVISNDGDYRLVVKDDAGNTAVVDFKIMKTPFSLNISGAKTPDNIPQGGADLRNAPTVQIIIPDTVNKITPSNFIAQNKNILSLFTSDDCKDSSKLAETGIDIKKNITVLYVKVENSELNTVAYYKLEFYKVKPNTRYHISGSLNFKKSGSKYFSMVTINREQAPFLNHPKLYVLYTFYDGSQAAQNIDINLIHSKCIKNIVVGKEVAKVETFLRDGDNNRLQSNILIIHNPYSIK